MAAAEESAPAVRAQLPELRLEHDRVTARAAMRQRRRDERRPRAIR